jgi:hypothetical protein
MSVPVVCHEPGAHLIYPAICSMLMVLGAGENTYFIEVKFHIITAAMIKNNNKLIYNVMC